MALSSPLSLSQFADLFHVADAKFVSQVSQEMSGTGGSDDLYADLSVPRWSLDITTGDLDHPTAELVSARYNWLVHTLTDFMMYNSTAKYPSTDPSGSLLTGHSVVLGTIADRYHAILSALPNDFTVPAGSYLQVTFGTSRTYLGQLVEDAVANGSGTTPSVTLTPGLPDSIVSGDAVNLLLPAARFRVQPNSLRPSFTSGKTRRLAFSARQTYGA
jgi:hypothetical protein